jgi:hypothetical protein
MPESSPEHTPKPSGLAAFWAELTCPSQLIERRGKRRKVVRVAMVYAVVGWLPFPGNIR